MIPGNLPQLRGGWLLFARLGWIVITLITVVMLVTALVYNAVAWWNWDLATCPKELYETCIGAIQANQQLGLSFHFWSVFYTLGAALEMVPFILVGGLIFWRKSDSLFELLFSLMLVLVGVFGIDYLVDNIFFNHYPMVHPVLHLLATLGSMLLILWYRFPDGRFVPRIFRWLAGLWILILLLSYFFPDSMLNVFTWPDPLPQVINNGLVLTLIGSVVYRYRYVSGSIERQQIKWVVTFGTIFGILDIAQDYIYPVFRTPGLSGAITNLTFLPLYYLSSALFAASFGVSILRYRLWDIDVIIRKSLIYGALTGTLTLVYLVLVIATQAIFPAGSQAGIIISTLAIAGLFTPLRRRIQRDIDQRFYRNKYNADKVLAAFTSTLREQVDPDQLIDLLTSVVEETMQPEHITLWLKPISDEKKPTQYYPRL